MPFPINGASKGAAGRVGSKPFLQSKILLSAPHSIFGMKNEGWGAGDGRRTEREPRRHYVVVVDPEPSNATTGLGRPCHHWSWSPLCGLVCRWLQQEKMRKMLDHFLKKCWCNIFLGKKLDSIFLKKLLIQLFFKKSRQYFISGFWIAMEWKGWGRR